MPIYEYVCDACGNRLEAMQKISDKPLKQCPACRKSKLRKLVSATAFRLKGGGWYETDFKKDGKKNLHGAADTGEGKPEKAADKAAEKPAEKAGDKVNATGAAESKAKPVKDKPRAKPRKPAD